MPNLGTAVTLRWNLNARSEFLGICCTHGRLEMVRSVMEGVALEIREMMESWLKTDIEISTLRLGGGPTKSSLRNQIQAEVYGHPVETLKTSESTVLGAAILVGMGSGVLGSIREGLKKW